MGKHAEGISFLRSEGFSWPRVKDAREINTPGLGTSDRED
jgi:hypothetical protein